MTDLERVREAIAQSLGTYFLDIFDTHLKEDAERSMAQLKVLQASEAELARLRERVNDSEESGRIWSEVASRVTQHVGVPALVHVPDAFDGLAAQRDTLLAALREIAAGTDDEAPFIARTAISEVEEEK